MEPLAPLPPRDSEEIQARLGGAWQDLAGARFLLTGCTGFFGPWLLEPLLAAHDALGLDLRAWVLTRDPEGFLRRMPHLALHPALELLEGDVRSFWNPGVPFTHLIHGAAVSNSTRDPQGPDAVMETIVEGTRRVLEIGAQAGVGRALFISSGAVYGVQPPQLEHMPEDHPWGHPDSIYARAKREAEALCLQSGLPVVIARAFAFLGPYLPLDAHFAAGNFLGDALTGRPIHIRGDGRPVRSYLYGTDLAVWLWSLLLKGVPRRSYNVGSEIAVTIEALARAIGAPKGNAVIIDQEPSSEAAPRYVPSTARARTELGLTQTVDLSEAIGRTLAWHTHSCEHP